MNRFTFPVYRLPLRYLSSYNEGWARCWPRPDYGPMEVQRSTMMNGIKVAAAKAFGAQMAACTIMYQAGSRYEVDNQIGASHFIRAASSASGCGYTSYSKMRFLQQNGASITCSSDRQSVAFTLRCPLPCFSELKHYLLDIACRCCYHQWEMDDRKPLIKDDLVRIDPEQRVIDLVQRACWAGPLANSIFCEEERIDEMTGSTLNCFVKSNFKTNQCTLGSVGVPFESTLKLAEMIESRRDIPADRPEVKSNPRGGFELYDLGRNSDTWIAVAVPGCGTRDLISLLKHGVVAAACGTGNIQTGQHSLDRMAQPPIGLLAGDDIFTEYKAFNVSYRETGVFGVVVKTKAATALTAALAAAEFLTKVGELNFRQIDVGKRRLKVSLALHDEDCVRVSEGLALQLANDVQIDNAKNSICMVDMLSHEDISSTAEALSSKASKMAFAVVGDVGAVPHNLEIVCRARY